MRTVKYNLPTHSPYYGFMLNGDKTFDIRTRKPYRQLMVGDYVKFWEQDPKTLEMTQSWFVGEVTYVMKTRDINFWPFLIDDLEKVDLIVFSVRVVEQS